MSALSPLPDAYPAQPNDPNVPLPVAPTPHTVNDVIEPMEQLSIAEHSNGDYNLALYEDGAVAFPCFQSAIQLEIQNGLQPLLNALQQLRIKLEQMDENFQHNFQQYHNDVRTMMRSEYLPAQKRLMNHNRGDGACGVPFEVVPFTNGDDPTKPPHNLPPLRSVYVINDLNEQQLFAYLAGYGTDPLQVPDDRRKNTLTRLIGSTSKDTERTKRYDTR